MTLSKVGESLITKYFDCCTHGDMQINSSVLAS